MLLEKSLDEIIYDHQFFKNSRISNWSSKRPFSKKSRFLPYFKKTTHLNRKDCNEPWTHDLYEGLGEKSTVSVPRQTDQKVFKSLLYRVKIENLHYELTEDDLKGLFKRIGPVSKLNIKYDRSGRSTGIAYVSFERIEDARNAISQFNGANAAGQPITLTLDIQPPRKPKREVNSLFSRISDFKDKPLHRPPLNNYKTYNREKKTYKTREDLDNELDKYMNVAIQSRNTQ